MLLGLALAALSHLISLTETLSERVLPLSSLSNAALSRQRERRREWGEYRDRGEEKGKEEQGVLEDRAGEGDKG